MPFLFFGLDLLFSHLSFIDIMFCDGGVFVLLSFHVFVGKRMGREKELFVLFLWSTYLDNFNQKLFVRGKLSISSAMTHDTFLWQRRCQQKQCISQKVLLLFYWPCSVAILGLTVNKIARETGKPWHLYVWAGASAPNSQCPNVLLFDKKIKHRHLWVVTITYAFYYVWKNRSLIETMYIWECGWVICDMLHVYMWTSQYAAIEYEKMMYF